MSWQVPPGMRRIVERVGVAEGAECDWADVAELAAATLCWPLGIAAGGVLLLRTLRFGNTHASRQAVVRADERNAQGTRFLIERLVRQRGHRQLLAALSVRPGPRWLDLGSGAGELLAAVAGQAGLRVGLDCSLPVVRVLRASRPGAHALQGDARALPFPAESFDLVTCSFVLHHLRDPLPLLAEARRVLTAQGRFVLVTAAFPFGYRVLHNLLLVRSSPDGDVRMYAPRHVRRLCSSVGFRIVAARYHPPLAHVAVLGRR